jgi:hypothetical protein
MPNAKSGYSTTLEIGVTTVGEITSIGNVDVSVETIDVTTLSDTFRQFIPGLADAGEVTFGGNFYPSDDGQAALQTAAFAKTESEFTITFPTTLGATWTFDGIITKFSTGEINQDGAIPFEITVKVTGEPDLGVEASTGLSNLSCTGAGGTLSPSFGAAVRAYTYGGVSASSITVTPTAASHTIKLYTDGTYVEDVTSGAASSAISLTINVGKLITLVVNESGKTPITYNIIAVKTS